MVVIASARSGKGLMVMWLLYASAEAMRRNGLPQLAILPFSLGNGLETQFPGIPKGDQGRTDADPCQWTKNWKIGIIKY
jgi:hypothetical protein